MEEIVGARRLKLADRKWSNRVLAHFLNDVVTVRLRDYKEVYDFFVTQRFLSSPNSLGKKLDLLNWYEGEKREGQGARHDGKVWLNFNSVDGARFVMLDAYVRYGDEFLSTFREKLLSLEARTDLKDVVRESIEETVGVSAEKYIAAALDAQRKGIEAVKAEKLELLRR